MTFGPFHLDHEQLNVFLVAILRHTDIDESS